MNKTPLAKVNETYGSKDKLVDAILGVLERGDEDKDALRKRLLSASNSKLMRLHGVATSVKEHGGKDKLVEAVLTLQSRSKDGDYKQKLATYSPARLLDLFRTGEQAKKAAEQRSKASAAPKTKTAKKAAPKKKGRAA